MIALDASVQGKLSSQRQSILDQSHKYANAVPQLISIHTPSPHLLRPFNSSLLSPPLHTSNPPAPIKPPFPPRTPPTHPLPPRIPRSQMPAHALALRALRVPAHGAQIRRRQRLAADDGVWLRRVVVVADVAVPGGGWGVGVWHCWMCGGLRLGGRCEFGVGLVR